MGTRYIFLTLVDDKMQPLDQNPWGISNIKITDNVKPGAKITFKFQVNVPAQIGNYDLQFAMMEGKKTFGSPSKSVKVTVQK